MVYIESDRKTYIALHLYMRETHIHQVSDWETICFDCFFHPVSEDWWPLWILSGNFDHSANMRRPFLTSGMVWL